MVIPTFNESDKIQDTLNNLCEYFDNQNYTYEIIVSDDGSPDNTVHVVKNFSEKHNNIEVISYLNNQGKGQAVRKGILEARGKYVMYLDADNSTPINEIEKLWPYTDTNQVIFGSRHHPTGKVHIPQAKHRIILSRLSNLIIRVLLLPGVYDTQCGFKLFKTDVAKQVFSKSKLKRWGFDFEILAIARLLKYKIKEVGVEWYNDPDSKVRAGREALRTLWDLIRVRIWLWQGKYN